MFCCKFLLSLTVSICAINSLIAPFIGPTSTTTKKPVNPHSTGLEQLMRKCETLEGKCKGQRRSVMKNRENLKKQLQKIGRKPDDIEIAFKKTFQAKKAYYKAMGWEQIEPANNGLFGDLLLNAKQAEYMIGQFTSRKNATISAAPSPGGDKPKRRKRANAVKWDEFPMRKWDLPITVYVDNAYAPEVAARVHYGLSVISSSTCIKFNMVTSPPSTGYYMHIIPENIAHGLGCGFAEVGRQDSKASFVSVIPNCGMSIPGVTIHEVLHALGFQHEHQRYDRDSYVVINVPESDPIYLENMAKLWPGHTSYGTQYDFRSIMHYALSSKVELMPGSGGEQYRGVIGRMVYLLSDSDIQALNIAYCSPPGCVDKHTDCGWWETFSAFCKRTDITPTMYCPQTCQRCS